MSYEVKCSKAEVRLGLADYFRELANFRRRKAEQFPEDSRNGKSVEILESVAAYCDRLSDEDENLARLFAMPCHFVDGGIFEDLRSPGERDYASRRAFDGVTEPKQLFSEWINDLEENYTERVKSRFDDAA